MSNLDDELRKAIEEGETPEERSSARLQDAELGPQRGSRQSASAAFDPALADSALAGPPSDEDEGAGSKRGLGLLLGLLAIGAGVLWLVIGTPSKALQHDTGVEQVLAAGKDAEGRLLNVEGTLVHGTLMKRDDPCEYRFKLRPKDANQRGELPVRFASCIVPDNFRDVAGMDVTVSARGRLANGMLAAEHISTKCPTKYEMQQRQKLGESTPHSDGQKILTFDEG